MATYWLMAVTFKLSISTSLVSLQQQLSIGVILCCKVSLSE